MTEELPHDASRAQLVTQVNKIQVSVNELQKDISSLLEIFQAIKGGVAFFILTVNLIKYLAGAAVAVGAIYSLWIALKTGKFPISS